MQKQSVFQSKLLPYALVAPQLAVVLVFFYWPAAQALLQSFLLQDAFGLSTSFVWFENYRDLLGQSDYFDAILRTFAFSFAIAAASLSFALLLAVMADRPLRGGTVYRTPRIWLCDRAAGRRRALGIHAQPVTGRAGARIAVDGDRLESAARRQPGGDADHPGGGLEADFLQFPVLPRRPAEHPEERDRGGRDRRREADAAVLDRDLPTAVADHLPAGHQRRYAFFDTFGIIDTMTHCGPASHRNHGLQGLCRWPARRQYRQLAAQSVILMVIVIPLTAVQFRLVERKVTY
jgi:sn-glycerol 3-phosphate transport system permease protein